MIVNVESASLSEAQALAGKVSFGTRACVILIQPGAVVPFPREARVETVTLYNSVSREDLSSEFRIMAPENRPEEIRRIVQLLEQLQEDETKWVVIPTCPSGQHRSYPIEAYIQERWAPLNLKVHQLRQLMRTGNPTIRRMLRECPRRS